MNYKDEVAYDDYSEDLERFLPVPDIYSSEKRPTKCWFTEKGYEYFHEAMEVFCDLIEYYLKDQPEKLTIDDYQGEVLYKDPYQVVMLA